MRKLTSLRRQLSGDVCNGIVGMRQAGSSQKDIVQVFLITQGPISKILKRHRLTGLTAPRPIYCRAKKPKARHDRYLLRLGCNRQTKLSSRLHADWIRFIYAAFWDILIICFLEYRYGRMYVCMFACVCVGIYVYMSVSLPVCLISLSLYLDNHSVNVFYK